MRPQSNTEHINQSILEKLQPMELPPLPENPLVSVLIANYNYGQYIGEAIESVLNQTYQNFEIVICDDGSTDNSLEVIRSYAEQDRRIKYIAKENGGQASALNECFYVAQGQIVCLLDSDDRFKPNKLENVVAALSNLTDVGMVIHPLNVIDQYGKKVRPLPIPKRLDSGWLAMDVLYSFRSWLCPPASGISFRYDIIKKILPIPERLKRNADGYIIFGLPLLTKIKALKIPLADYRLHVTNITGIGWASPQSIEYVIDLKLYLKKAILNKLNINVDSKEEKLVYDLAESIILYYLQTGRVPSIISPNIEIKKLFSYLKGKKRYIYRFLIFFPCKINTLIIKQWHTNILLKRISDRIRLILNRGQLKNTM